MRIVNLEEFRALPSGTVYMKYQPCVFGPLEMKGDTWEVDHLCADIISEIDSSDSGS